MGNVQPICTFGDLRKLEVINVCDGSRLGCISDLELDLCLGRVTALILPNKIPLCEVFQKCHKKEIRIPWCNIERIGNDTILIKIAEELL